MAWRILRAATRPFVLYIEIRTLSFDAASSVPTKGLDEGTVTRTRDPRARSSDARVVAACGTASPGMHPARAKSTSTDLPECR